MGITSRIVNILVLLAAIAAAVCAFMLFQKRELITKGREMMAKAVVKAVKTIDPSIKITSDDMLISKSPDELKNSMDVLDKNTNKIVKQRKAIAETLAETTNMINDLESSQAPDEKLEEKDLTSYQTSQAKREAALNTVTKKIEYYNKKNEAVRTVMKSIAGAVRESEIPAEDLKDPEKMAAGFDKYGKKAEKYTRLAVKLGEHVEAISDKVGFEKKPNTSVSNETVEDDLRQNMENMEAYVAEHEKFKSDNAKLKTEVTQLTEDVKTKTEALKKETDAKVALQQEVEKNKKEIKRLKHIIDPNSDEDNDGKPVVQADYSMFLRKLNGKITYVNEEHGFVAIDLGSKSTIMGPGIDGKPIPKPAPIPEGSLMTVTTSLDPEKAQYVARIAVIQIGPTASIANIMPTPGRTMPKVGDIVFFSASDLAQMKAITAAKLAAESAAQAAAPAAETASAATEEKKEETKAAKSSDEDIEEDLDDEDAGSVKKEDQKAADKKEDEKKSSSDDEDDLEDEE